MRRNVEYYDIFYYGFIGSAYRIDENYRNS